jgi:hypothetical protein
MATDAVTPVIGKYESREEVVHTQINLKIAIRFYSHLVRRRKWHNGRQKTFVSGFGFSGCAVTVHSYSSKMIRGSFRISIKIKVMKIIVFLLMAFVGCAITAKGQDARGEVYWVVESNSNIPHYSVVKLYDQQNELVHEVKLDTRLDITNRKHRRVLVQIVKRYSHRVAAGRKKIKSVTSV